LPLHFVASSLGTSAGILELAGFLNRATNRMALVACIVETCVGVSIEMRRRAVDKPLRDGRTGLALRIAETLSGPLPLILRIFLGQSLGVRRAASVLFILGAIASRYVWIAAGRESSRDAGVLFASQRPRLSR
jgi:hypothetical protein